MRGLLCGHTEGSLFTKGLSLALSLSLSYDRSLTFSLLPSLKLCLFLILSLTLYFSLSLSYSLCLSLLYVSLSSTLSHELFCSPVLRAYSCSQFTVPCCSDETHVFFPAPGAAGVWPRGQRLSLMWFVVVTD